MYWLNVFFLINGIWMSGEAFEGWHARGPYPTLLECIAEKFRSETEFSDNPREYPAKFECSRTRPTLIREFENCSLGPDRVVPHGRVTVWSLRCS